MAREALTELDARAAGLAGLDELLSLVDRRPSGAIYRIDLRHAGPDSRIALRESVPVPEQVEDVARRLERLDRASRHGPWTAATLRAIDESPGVRAADLAAALGRERAPFKLDVRKLKEIGLTESLSPGYRLSPRGRAVVAALSISTPQPPEDGAVHD